MDEEDVESADRWFDRHGAAALILGRLVPGVRSVVAIPAGLRRMHPLRFGVYTAIGAGGWNAALLGAGALLGHQWQALSGWIDVLSWIAVGAAVVLAGAWVVRRRRRRPRRSDESATTR
jgi:membrane protein DedA with SNARE-associated domain